MSVLCSPFISCVKCSSNDTTAEFQRTLFYRSCAWISLLKSHGCTKVAWSMKKERKWNKQCQQWLWEWVDLEIREKRREVKTLGSIWAKPICLQKLFIASPSGPALALLWTDCLEAPGDGQHWKLKAWVPTEAGRSAGFLNTYNCSCHFRRWWVHGAAGDWQGMRDLVGASIRKQGIKPAKEPGAGLSSKDCSCSTWTG